MPDLKQGLFFLLAVLLPSTALVWLSVHLLGQERELAEKRLAEQRERLGREDEEALERELRTISDRLGTIEPARTASEEKVPRSSGLALVARVVQDRLVLPWEGGPETLKTVESLREGRQLDRVFSTVTSALSGTGVAAAGLDPSREPPAAVPLALGPAAACLARDYLDESGERWPTRQDVAQSRQRLQDYLALLAQAAQLKTDFPAVRALLTPTRSEPHSPVTWTLTPLPSPARGQPGDQPCHRRPAL